MPGELQALEPPEHTLTLQKVAVGLFKSGLFPNAKNEYGAFAIITYGRELGVPAMMSLKNINIISGQLACNAQLMLALAVQRGVTYTVTEETDKVCTIVFKRGEMEYTASFTEEDAKAAGLLEKDNWRKYRRDMLYWRAVAKGIRRVAPDAVMGLYTPDEISEGQYVDVKDIPPEPDAIQGEVVGEPSTDIPEGITFSAEIQRMVYEIAQKKGHSPESVLEGFTAMMKKEGDKWVKVEKGVDSLAAYKGDMEKLHKKIKAYYDKAGV